MVDSHHRQSQNEKAKSVYLNDDTILARVRDKYALVRATSARGTEIVVEVVAEYASELDEFVDTFTTYLDEIKSNHRVDFDDATLQRMVARIPALLYRLADRVDDASLQSDVAKAARENVYARNYIDAPGKTIPDRQSHASLATSDETTIVDLTKHVYARLKNKIENGNLLFDAVRKIMSSRDNERAVFGREMKR